MAYLKEPLYTLVEHSGLHGAVEDKAVTTKGEATKVRKAGGVLVDSYQKADKAQEIVNYANTSDTADFMESIVPNMEGDFAKTKIDGYRIYKPTPAINEKIAAL